MIFLKTVFLKKLSKLVRTRSRTRFSTKFRTTVCAFVATLAFSVPALALDLDEAKAKGLVGEVNSGYVGAVKSSKEVDALVDDINKKRKAYYQKIADKNGISLLAVEVRAGQKAIEKTERGGLINTGEGWERK